MIPGIFAITNNKCYEAYKLIFTDLLSKITIKADNTKLKFSIFTSDFKKALNTSIKVEFINLCPNIRHIGCMHHYMTNIEKQIRLYGYGGKKRNTKKL